MACKKQLPGQALSLDKLILSFKGKTLDEYLLTGERTSIGSDPVCTVHIDSLAVAPVHACITSSGDGYSIEENDPDHPVIVNHQKTANSPLKHGDTILLGKHTLKFVVEEDAPQAEEIIDDITEDGPGNTTACLQIMTGQNVGKTIRLTNAVTNIGKRGTHTASIARREDGYHLAHLEGDNPTLVGGNAVQDETRILKDGDIIELGIIKMQFYME